MNEWDGMEGQRPEIAKTAVLLWVGSLAKSGKAGRGF